MRSFHPDDSAGLAEHLLSNMGPERRIVALAGAPGSGKSTLADALAAEINRRGVTAEVVPMDGYHYDDCVLEARGLRPRKGAPETFDVLGFAALLGRLRRNADPEVAIPVFDRSIEIARAGARLIPQETRLLIVEGNYLLLNRGHWSSLAELYDETVFLDVAEGVLRDRLQSRWVDAGLDAEGIAWKLDGNDLPNGRLVREASFAADIVLKA